MIKIVAVLTLFWTVLLSVGLYVFAGQDMAVSCLVGGIVMVFNLGSLYLIWKFIFSKKSIALAVLVIIFKYVILGLILWNLDQIRWIKPLGFVLGLSSLMLGILASLIYRRFKSSETV